MVFGPRLRKTAGAACALLLCAGGFFFGTGLDSPAWPVWLAPLPVLWMAPRLPWWGAGLTALFARLLGGLSLWEYQRRISIPLIVALPTLLLPAAVFALAVLYFRFCLQRSRPGLAVLTLPCATVAYEYMSSLGGGTYGSLAYTQMHLIPIVQIAALTGLWGITFLVMLFSPLVAVAVGGGPGTSKRAILALLAIFGCALGFGAWRMWTTPSAPSVPVALVETDTPANVFPTRDADVMQLMRDYAEQVQLLARQGAKIVVLPEMTAPVQESTSNAVDQVFLQAARDAGVPILLGVQHSSARGKFNEARFYSPVVPTPAVYRKQHPVPGLEQGTTPGQDVLVLTQPSGRIGLEICADMDYRDPASRYGRQSVDLLLVPAWDMDIDRWWHARMAVLRGVEHGLTIVRSSKRGLLTVSDDRGRVLASANTSPARTFTSLLATAPVRHEATLYQRWGDWFAWVDLAGLAALLALPAGHKRGTSIGVRRLYAR